MTKIESFIETNYDILKEIEILSSRIKIQNDNKRDMLFAGFYRNALSHYCAITILIEKQLYNSAFALMRVLFENVVRARYMYIAFDKEKIDKLYSNQNWNDWKPFPGVNKMCEEFDIENKGESLYKHIFQKVWKILNDYTHSGANQIARNFNEKTAVIESNFDEDLIVSALQSIRIMITSLAIMYLDEIGIREKYMTEKEVRSLIKYLQNKEKL